MAVYTNFFISAFVVLVIVLIETNAQYSMPTCQMDNDCTRSTLGQLSRCSNNTGICECYDTRTGKQETGHYNNVCVYKKRLGEICNTDDECRAGFHHNAECLNHESYQDKAKTCQCPANKRCDGSSGAAGGHYFDTKTIFVIGFTTVFSMIFTKSC